MTGLPAPLRGHLFTREQAATAGACSDHLKPPYSVKVLPGVFVGARTHIDHRLRCRAALLVAPPGSAICGRSALQLWGLAAADVSAPVDLVLPPDSPHWPGPAGVKAVRSSIPVRTRGSIVVAADVWVLLGHRCELDELVAVGEQLLGRTSIEALRRNLRRGDWPYHRRLRQALALLRPGVAQPSETALRLAIIRAGLPEPACGVSVPCPAGASAGEALVRFPLAYPELRVAILDPKGSYPTDATIAALRQDRWVIVDPARTDNLTEDLWLARRFAGG